MKHLLVAFYDKKTKSYSDVVTVPNLPTACRMAEQLVKRDGTIQAQYPNDFDLYCVCEYVEDEKEGIKLTPIVPHSLVCRCSDFKAVENA